MPCAAPGTMPLGPVIGPRIPGDEAILARAAAERRVLVTLDKDFGELAVIREQPHAGIVRLVGFPALRQGEVCVATLASYGTDLEQGALVTVERGRVCVRRRSAGS